MTGPRSPALYESPALQAVTGPALRPGGLELTQRALFFCGLPAGARVIDIGCGTGETLRYLRQHWRLRAVGLDRSPRMLHQARRRVPHLPLVKADAACLPVRDACLSAVLCECVLSLVEDRDAAWREILRVLAPGGLLVLADIYARVPAQAAGPASLPADCCIRGARPRDEWMDRMRRCGLMLLAWEDHSGALKRLAARLVFAYGSLPALWGDSRVCGEGYSAALRRARPGYFLAVARKE